MQIPQYTRGLVLERATPNTVNLGMIDKAGIEAQGVSTVADIGTQIAQKMKETNDLTAVNAAVIRRQKEDLDFEAASRKENEANPLGYAKRVEPEYQKRDEMIMESLPSEEAKNAYKSTAEKLNLRNYENNLNWETKRSTEMFANTADQAIKDLEVMAYRGAPLDELKRNRQATSMTLGSVLAPDQLAKFDVAAGQRITKSFMEGQIDRNPYEAKKILDSRVYDSALGADNIQSLTDNAESEIRKAEKEAEIKEEKQISLYKVGMALEGKAILDPHDKGTGRAVDIYYADLVTRLPDMPPEQQKAAQVEFVKKTGIYPAKMQEVFSAQLNNGSTEQKVLAAEMIDSIATTNSSTVLQIPSSERARAAAIVQNINAGLQPKQAVEAVDKSTFQKDTPEYKTRLDNFNRKGGEKDKFKRGAFTEAFRVDPKEIPAGMQADYETLNETYYMGGMDAEASSQAAIKTVKANWSVTNTDGHRRFMKYSPEAVYGNEAGTEWIGTQLKEEIGKVPSVYESGKEPDLLLAVDPRSIKQPDKVYQVFMKNEAGAAIPYLLENGQQAIFKPNYETSSDFLKYLEENEGDKEKAMAAAIKNHQVFMSKAEKSEKKKEMKKQRALQFKKAVEGLIDGNN